MDELNEIIKTRKLYALNKWMSTSRDSAGDSQTLEKHLESIVTELNRIDTIYEKFSECTVGHPSEAYMPLMNDNIVPFSQCTDLLADSTNSFSCDSWQPPFQDYRKPMLWMPEYLWGTNTAYLKETTYNYPDKNLILRAVSDEFTPEDISAGWKKQTYTVGTCATARSRYQWCDQYLWNFLAIPITQITSRDADIDAQVAVMRETCESALLKKHSRTRNTPKKFGISIKKVEISDWPNKSLFPIAPLILYERFAHMKKCKNLAHKLAEQYKITSNDEGESPSYPMDRLTEADALYYEMCIGVSLTSEITALLLDIQKSFKDLCKFLPKEAIAKLWNKDIKGFWRIFSDLLEDHSEFLVNCPLVFWRSAMIREVLESTYEKFFLFPALNARYNKDYELLSVTQDELRTYFRKMFCLKLNQINMNMLSVTRFLEQNNRTDQDLLQQIEWDCQQVIAAEKTLAHVLYSGQELDKLEKGWRSLLRYDAITYQSGGYSPENTQTYKLLRQKIFESKPILLSDTYPDVCSAICDASLRKDGDSNQDVERWLNEWSSIHEHPHVSVPYHFDIKWRIAKRRMDENYGNESGKRTTAQLPIDFETIEQFPYYVRDELAKIREDYTNLLNSPNLNRGDGIFRYCDMSHKNMELIKDEADATKYLGATERRRRSAAPRIFEQVHKTLYPNGYIDFKL